MRWGNTLTDMVHRFRKHGLRLLPVLVVTKGSDLPSTDADVYHRLGLANPEAIRKEQERCFSYVWNRAPTWMRQWRRLTVPPCTDLRCANDCCRRLMPSPGARRQQLAAAAHLTLSCQPQVQRFYKFLPYSRLRRAAPSMCNICRLTSAELGRTHITSGSRYPLTSAAQRE